MKNDSVMMMWLHKLLIPSYSILLSMYYFSFICVFVVSPPHCMSSSLRLDAVNVMIHCCQYHNDLSFKRQCNIHYFLHSVHEGEFELKGQKEAFTEMQFKKKRKN